MRDGERRREEKIWIKWGWNVKWRKRERREEID